MALLSKTRFLRSSLTELFESLTHPKHRVVTQETVYEFKTDMTNNTTSIGAVSHGTVTRKNKSVQFANILGGEIDSVGNISKGGVLKYYKDFNGKEHIEARGDSDPSKYLKDVGLSRPSVMKAIAFPAYPLNESTGHIEGHKDVKGGISELLDEISVVPDIGESKGRKQVSGGGAEKQKNM
jgi:hypothetical protein